MWNKIKLGCDACPFVPSVLIWLLYLSVFALVVGSNLVFGNASMFVNVTQSTTAIKTWGLAWLAVPVLYGFGLLNWHWPHYAAQWMRRCLSFLVFINGTWLIYLSAQMIDNFKVTQITGVFLWGALCLACALILVSGKIYRPGMAGQHYGLARAQGILGWLQW